MQNTSVPLIFLLVIAFFAVTQTLFIVDQREQAILLQFGQPVGEPRGPGLHIKIPMVQNVARFDNRILSVDPEPEQVVISSDNSRRAAPKTPQAEGAKPAAEPVKAEAGLTNVTGEPIILDTFARYKITDPQRFMRTLRTITAANNRIEGILKNATKAALGKTSLRSLLSNDRSAIMHEIRESVNASVKKDQLGIEIVDVRIVRADLTPSLRTSTVNRMVSELRERATETRAKGEQRALEIRSTAEKERTVLIAEAERDAQILRGEGDRQAIKTYADAFNKDQEFFAFIRSMEAYDKTLANPETRLILSPDSKFFRYFNNKGQQ